MSVVKITDPFPKWIIDDFATLTDEQIVFMNKWNYIYEKTERVIKSYKEYNKTMEEALDSVRTFPVGLKYLVGEEEIVRLRLENDCIKDLITENWNKI